MPFHGYREKIQQKGHKQAVKNQTHSLNRPSATTQPRCFQVGGKASLETSGPSLSFPFKNRPSVKKWIFWFSSVPVKLEPSWGRRSSSKPIIVRKWVTSVKMTVSCEKGRHVWLSPSSLRTSLALPTARSHTVWASPPPKKCKTQPSII